MNKIIKKSKAVEKLITKGYANILETKNTIAATRPDGLRVFFDKISPDDPNKKRMIALNKIRAAATPDQVILSVAAFRAVQIAENYARSYARHDTGNLSKTIEKIIASAAIEAEVT